MDGCFSSSQTGQAKVSDQLTKIADYGGREKVALPQTRFAPGQAIAQTRGSQTFLNGDPTSQNTEIE